MVELIVYKCVIWDTYMDTKFSMHMKSCDKCSTLQSMQYLVLIIASLNIVTIQISKQLNPEL